MRDDRVRMLATADAIAHMHRRKPLFVFKSDHAIAVYWFGKRLYQSKAWNAGDIEPFRSAYKRFHQRVEHILREPTEAELAGCLPALHPLTRNGKQLTVGEYRDFAHQAWHAKQVSEIIRLIQQEGVQYIKEDVDLAVRKSEAKKIVTSLFADSHLKQSKSRNREDDDEKTI